MTEDSSNSTKNQIRNLLLVLLCGVACAAFGTLWMVYYYGPSGKYLASNVILDPNVLPKISYHPQDSITRDNTRFVFDKIVFSFFDGKTNQRQNKIISSDLYKKFYQLVYREKSLEPVPESVSELFSTSPSSSIFIYVKPETHGKIQASETIFQHIQFVNHGDYYRVELRDNESKTSWAYFYHLHIYQEVMNLLNEGY